MSRKKKISEEDRAVFADAMRGVKRLQHDNVVPTSTRPKPRRITHEAAHAPLPLPLPPEQGRLASNDAVQHAHTGVQKRVLQDLRRGKIAPTAQLDLHGYTVARAESVLNAFLRRSAADGHRCVRIIHGKGAHRPGTLPALKNAVAYWLPLHPAVLAFCSAPVNAGGAGAVHVLLRKSA